MKEIWKDIKGYEGLYQVSNLGRIKSVRKKIIKSPSLAGRGYYRLTLCNNGKNKSFYIHRLVAQAFISNPNNLSQVNHKDENKLNNCVDNLEWTDCKSNINYGLHNVRRYISTAIYYLKKDYAKNKEIISQLEDVKSKL